METTLATNPRRERGAGRIYQPKYEKDGKAMVGRWRIRYTCGRKVYDEKLPDDWQNTKTAARDYLKQKWAEIRDGKFAAGADKLRYTDLRDGLLRYYEVNGLKSLKTARGGQTKYLSGQSHLDKFFDWNPRALDITRSIVERFKQSRIQVGASNANLNLSLGLLGQMFSVAIDEGRLSAGQVPKVTKLKAPAARKGFLEPKDFARLHDALPDDLRPVAMLGFDTGMRLGEVSNLRWESIDLTGQGEIHLSAEETKTGVARTIPLGRMLEIFRIMRAKHPANKYVFGGSNSLGNFRKRWNNACVKAGLGQFLCVACSGPMVKSKCEVCSSGKRKYDGKTFHDLRRSAVRNMVRSGISEKVAMSISGHRTRAVFDRYNITSPDDLHAAARRQNEYVEHSIEESTRKLVPTEAQNEPEKKFVVQ
jgi:integrase